MLRVEFVDKEAGQAAMIQVDLQKALDRPQHDVLWTVLKLASAGNLIFDGIRMATPGAPPSYYWIIP